MALTINIIDKSGKAAGSHTANADVFGISPNISVMHDAVRRVQASWRAGTQSTKNRTAVRGGGAKPFRQKGTGRARSGSIRSPQNRGGGVVFGPTPRSYDFKLNKKVVSLAMRSALSAKLADKELYVVKEFKFDQPSTKAAQDILTKLNLAGRTTLIIDDEDINTYLSFRNLAGVIVVPQTAATTLDIVDNKNLILTKQVVEHFEDKLNVIARSEVEPAPRAVAGKQSTKDKTTASTAATKTATAKSDVIATATASEANWNRKQSTKTNETKSAKSTKSTTTKKTTAKGDAK